MGRPCCSSAARLSSSAIVEALAKPLSTESGLRIPVVQHDAPPRNQDRSSFHNLSITTNGAVHLSSLQILALSYSDRPSNMTSVSASSIAFATVGTIATGCLAYAVYFDYKRRSDPSFRKALKKESRREAKVAKVEAEESGKRQRRQIRAIVDEANNEGFPDTAEDKEALFMQEVSQGETLCQDRESGKHPLFRHRLNICSICHLGGRPVLLQGF